MKILLLILFLFSSTVSSQGILNLIMTTDRPCLVNLNPFEITVRLQPFESKSIDIPIDSFSYQISIYFELLDHFSGESLFSSPLFIPNPQIFYLENNGRTHQRFIHSLSILSTFHCQPGFFGPFCQRRSRITVPTTTTVAQEPSGFNINNEWIIYISLIAFILLLIIANCAIFCCYRRPIPSKYIDVKDSELFRIDSSREENSNSIIYSTIV
uniref:Uncharacterized protein n=2 Tax=Caenorhabditis tropicalis TaxID=1561998 RepID=A0A1I7UD20_9PELO